MIFVAEYGLPLLAALLLIMFLMFLPDLRRCALPEFVMADSRGSLLSHAAILLVTLVYALLAFYNLGNTESPESFYNISVA